jgi:hypothetical protein
MPPIFSMLAAGTLGRLNLLGIVAFGAGVGFHFGGEDKEAAALFTAVGIALVAFSLVSYWLAKKLRLSDTRTDFNSQ